MLIIKYSSTVMQGKRKLCECHTRFFLIKKLSSWAAIQLRVIENFGEKSKRKFLDNVYYKHKNHILLARNLNFGIQKLISFVSSSYIFFEVDVYKELSHSPFITSFFFFLGMFPRSNSRAIMSRPSTVRIFRNVTHGYQ